MAKRIHQKEQDGGRSPEQKGLYALNRVTRRLRLEELNWLPLVGRIVSSQSLEDDVIGNVTNERVSKVFERLKQVLTPLQLDILMKSKVENMSLSEIARQSRVSEQSVRTALTKALERINTTSIGRDLKNLIAE